MLTELRRSTPMVCRYMAYAYELSQANRKIEDSEFCVRLCHALQVNLENMSEQLKLKRPKQASQIGKAHI